MTQTADDKAIALDAANRQVVLLTIPTILLTLGIYHGLVQTLYGAGHGARLRGGAAPAVADEQHAALTTIVHTLRGQEGRRWRPSRARAA